MSDNRKVQIPVEVDATGAKAGFEQVKQGGRDMAQALQQSAQQASQAVDKVGDGAAPAAAKLEGAARSMASSIQRTTAVMEAGERGTRKFYEALAIQRGVNPDVLKPYLDQLDAVRAKQAQASAALGGTAVSAKQLQFALRGVPAQMTDIVTSLASGQRPMQVLLQQGGQLKDMFGGIGPAARALGGYIAGLVNPFTIGAAVIGGFALAAHQGSEELRAFQAAATLNGNAIGVSVSRFSELRDSLAGIAGTKGKAAEALTAIAQSGLAAGDNVRGIAEAAILMEKATGQSIAKTVEQFKDLQKSPADAAAKLSEQTNFLTAAVYKQIKALEDQGRATDAAKLAEQTYAEALKSRATEVIASAGLMEKAWRGITGTAKAAWDAMLGIGRDLSPGERLAQASADVARIRAQLAGVGTFSSTGGGAAVGGASASRRAALERDLEAAKLLQAEARRRVEIEARNTHEKAEQNRLEALGIQFSKDGAQFDTRRQQREKELTKARTEGQQLVAAGIITEKELTERLTAIRKKYTEAVGESGIAAQTAAKRIAQIENERLQRGIDTGDFSQATKLTEAERRVIQVQEELKGSLLDTARANKVKELAAAQAAVQDERATQALQQQYDATKKAREEITRQADAAGQQADAIQQQAIAQEAANAQYGKSKTAIEESTLALLKLQLAEADSSDTFDPRYVAGLRAKVEAQERYVDALQKAEFLQKSRSLDEAGRVAAEETQTLQLEVSLLGRSQQEREKVIAQRRVEVSLAKELAEIEKLNLGTGPDADAKRRELQDKARSNARVQASNAEQKVIVDEWQRTTDSINQSLTDALLRGFESGKDFASNFRDTLKNMFSTMVLRPIIQAVMSPVSGALAGIGQSIGGAIVGGGGSSLGSLGGLGMGAAGLGGLFGAGGLSGSMMAGAGWLTGATTFGGSMAAAGSLIGTGTAGGIASGLGMAAGTLGPIALGAMAAYAILGGNRGGPKTESGFGVGVPLRGNPSTSKAIADAVEAQYKSIAGELAKDLQLGVFTATDPQGDAMTQLGFEAQLNGRSISSRAGRLGGIENVGRSEAELAAAIGEESSRVVLKALAESDLPDKIGDYLRQLGDIDALSGGALQKAVEKLQKAMTERQTLEQQYFDLTHTELERLTATREKERKALDDTNRSLYDAVAAITDLRVAEAKARDALVAAYERESDALRGVIERNHGFAESLRAVRDSLASSGGSLTPTQRTAQTGAAFQRTLALATSGDEKALQGLGDAGRSYVDALRDTARNRVELAAGIARVQAGLTTAAASADSRATVAQQQLDAMTQQLSALGLINTSVLSVGEALGAFLNAQTAIAQEQLRYTAQIAAEQVASDQAAAAVVAAVSSVSAPVASAQEAWQQFAGHYADNQYFGPIQPYVGPLAASGGYRTTGVLKVGEEGPEVVDFDTPGRVYTSEQTRGMFATNAELLPAVRELCQAFQTSDDNRRREAIAMLQQLSTVASKLKKFDVDGLPPERVVV